ncbi:hypothetical protein [Paenibacillus sp. TSA_86.1]|uniref:hypothetical protein n=1 Tax=Paenibacillus sp. TSA_86.1 TaxID=3415649 RepID=UPI00404542DA
MTKQQGIVIVVSVSIVNEGKVLIIQENKASVRNTWNFPSGRVEYGDILELRDREVMMRITDNVMSKKEHPLTLFQSQL